MHYFGRCTSELAELFPLPYSRDRSTRYSNRMQEISVTIPRCYEDVFINSFFLRTAILWNFLPAECFSLYYDLNGFKSKVNRHLFLWNLSNHLSYMLFILFVLFILFLVTRYLVVAVQSCLE